MGWVNDILGGRWPSGPWERLTDGCSIDCCGNPNNCSNEGQCEQPIRQQLQAVYGDDWERVYYGEVIQ